MTLSVKLSPAQRVSGKTLVVAVGIGVMMMVLLAVLEQAVGELAVTV